MKRYLKNPIYFGIIYILFLACQSVDLFKVEDQETTINKDNYSDLAPFLQVVISGGFAGINEKLAVYPNGLAILWGHPAYIEKRTLFSPEKMQQIRDLFVYNDILNVPNIGPGRIIADALTYDISISSGTISHFIITSGAQLPANVNNLLFGIDQTVDEVINDGLKFELLPMQNYLAEDSLQIMLSITNVSIQTIMLQFPTGQEFDFYLRSSTENDRQTYEWNWAGNKSFTQAIQTKNLAPKENLIYRYNWNRAKEAATELSGAFYIGGRLLSTPGGIPRELPVIIP